jgi:hypothetical protein
MFPRQEHLNQQLYQCGYLQTKLAKKLKIKNQKQRKPKKKSKKYK